MQEEQEHTLNQQPGLPEALFPGIGNGAGWELDPHNRSLRIIDPGQSFNDRLLDESDRSRALEYWQNPLKSDLGDIGSFPLEESLAAPVKAHVPREPVRVIEKIVTSSREKTAKPDWFEEMDEDLVLKEDPNKYAEQQTAPSPEELPAPKPEGKRVRKAVKQAKKEAKKRKIVSQVRNSEELSPFTKWLKGLKGSEYVHPYEDDYALEQSGSASNEVVSETFADLLAAQGYRERAIGMYQQLMAKFPEKSSFFAAKIEALK